jgi:hypothetical protein
LQRSRKHIWPEREARLHWADCRGYRGLFAALLLISPLGFSALAGSGDANSIVGFSARGAAEEVSIEQQFRSLTSTDQISKFHRYLTSEPHPAGSARNNELAQWVAEQWRQQGLEDVTIHEYDVLNSSPREISLEMVHPGHFHASLREDPYDVDPDTKNPKADGAYLGYSASGEVTAPVVYAHSGNPEDYDYLRAHGIDVRGKIVLVRYSNPYSYRGFKALTAERLGAAAILIYSDPQEDGYTRGKVYPDGPWGPESHIQRGAITYDFLEPGDPLTPGWASVPGREAHTNRAGNIAAENYGRAAFVARREAAAGKNGRAGGAGVLAGRVAAEISSGREASASSFKGGHGHPRPAVLRDGSADSRQ